MGKIQDFILKNKFILFIILIIFNIIGLGMYMSGSNNIDRNSYIILVKGNGILNNKPLKIDIKNNIKIGDTVRTLGTGSLAVLEWGDGSVTRLGGNSSIKINELYLSQNLDRINISFKLLSGKSWSTVISFLGDKSYFKEEFRESVAAVRGTIFNVDLESEYLNVIDHKVTITKENGENIIVNKDNPIDLINFKFISLEEFITKFKDKTWENLNKSIDKELFISLRNKIEGDFKNLINLDKLDLDNINNIKKEELYNKILSDYQKLNFIKSDDDTLFKKKLELKEALIKLSSNEDKKLLIQNTFYDLKDILKTKSYEKLDVILPIFNNNKDILKNINFNLNLNSLPEDIYNKFINLKGLFMNNQNIKNSLKSIDTTIKNGLDSIKNNLTDKYNNSVQKNNSK